ncbi:MAG: hypothetical protein F6K16_30940, partial [Symploca sp. SIO2B6]|nr:hypothetical protein [Symploca sp. SIO2B6]
DSSRKRRKQRHFPAIFFSGNYYSLCRTETTEQAAFRTAAKLMQQGRSLTLTQIPKGYAIWILELDAIPSSVTPLPSANASTSLPTRSAPVSAVPVSSAPVNSAPVSSTSANSPLLYLSPSSPVNAPAPSLEPIACGQFAYKYISDSQRNDSLPYEPPELQSPTDLGKVLTTHDQFQLCYLHLPHSQEPCLAVHFGECYYRFFRVVKTIRQAAKLFKLLTHSHERSVITKMSTGYGLWILAEA